MKCAKNVSSYVMGTALFVASFPGHSHLQLTSILEFLQRGEAWRIWSHTMTSGGQMVDTQEAVDLKVLSCNITGLEAKSICEAASIQFIVHNAWSYYGCMGTTTCVFTICT